MFTFTFGLLGLAMWIVMMLLGVLAHAMQSPLLVLAAIGFTILVSASAGGASDETAPAPKPGVRGSDTRQAPSGFVTSTSIKTLLVSGTALFFFSVYLFLRSYWALISPVGKFSGLVTLTVAMYAIGVALLQKGLVSRTAQALVGIGLGLIPACVYGANVMILGGRYSNDAMLCFGCLLMAPASALTMVSLPTAGLALLGSASVIGALFFGGAAWAVAVQVQAMLLAVGAAVIVAIEWPLRKHEDVSTGLLRGVALGLATDVAFLFTQHFFWHDTLVLPTVANFALIGAVLAAVSRRQPSAAYGASLAFTGSVIYLLRHLHVPVYEYGYVLVPAGFLSFVRARYFERSGRPEMARPYFGLGQIALALSVICVLPIVGSDTSMVAMIAALAAAALGYAAAGAMYSSPFYCFASGLVSLLIAGSAAYDAHLDAASIAFVFAAVASVFVLVGFTGGRLSERRVGNPLVLLGLLTMTCCVTYLAGLWLEEIWRAGALLPPADLQRVEAGLWTGALGGAAYLYAAVARKQPAFLYPALLSFSWVYVSALQWNGIPVDLVALSLIVVASSIGYVLLAVTNRLEAARCFALWAQVAGWFVMIGAAVANGHRAVPAMVICTLAFVPGLMLNRIPMLVSMLLGVYFTHFVWFESIHPSLLPAELAEYALQLVAVNIGVVFLRSLLSWIRPQRSVLPFQILSIGAGAAALVLSFYDFSIAWQVFLAHGLLVGVASRLHHEGRFDWVAIVLCLGAGELFVFSRDITYVEAYTVPFVALLLAGGYRSRANAALRDALYASALILLYAPSSVLALHETWEWHGIFLGVASLVMMLWGIQQRSKTLTFPSALVLIVNGLIQSRQMFLVVPRWLYLGTAGLGLITLAGLFEFQRDTLNTVRKSVASTFDNWE